MRNRANLTLALMLLTAGCTGDRTLEPTTTTSQPRITTTATSQTSTLAETAEPVTTESPTTTTTVAEPGLMWARVPHDASVFGDSSYDQSVQGVVAGGPGLVAVGSDASGGDSGYPDPDAAVWTSVDGLAWARVPHDEAVFGGTCPQNSYGNDCAQGMYGLAAGGPGLVAVGYESDSPGMEENAAVWTSADGLTWTQVRHDEAVFGGPDNQSMVGVVAGGPGLVAVGYDESSGDRDAAAWTSVDGVTWTRVPHDEAVFGGPGWQAMEGVAAGGPGLVAVGYDASDRGAAVWTSDDGLAWTQAPYDAAVFGSLQLESVAAAVPGLVAVGSDSSGGDPDAAVITSADGLVWRRVPHDESIFGGPSWQGMYGVAATGFGVVAVGHDRSGDDWDAVAWTSADGLAWARARSDGGFGGWYDQGMYCVTAGGPGVVAVGYADGQGIYAETNAAIWVGSPSG